MINIIQYILDNIAFVSKHTGLQTRHARDGMRYLYSFTPLIYGIICSETNRIYIGSTWDSVRRFRQHLVTGHTSNLALQEDIKEHGLKSITVFIFTNVDFPESLSKAERKALLEKVEQEYKDMFPLDVQYRSNRSVSKRRNTL